jgi:hypothetical protein
MQTGRDVMNGDAVTKRTSRVHKEARAFGSISSQMFSAFSGIHGGSDPSDGEWNGLPCIGY